MIICFQYQQEKERLEALKLQHIQKFIEALRTELVSLWDKCYYDTAQRDSFLPMTDSKLHIIQQHVQLLLYLRSWSRI